MKKLLITSLAAMLVSNVASAQTISDRFRLHRIQQGFKQGQITGTERFQLKKEVKQDAVVTRLRRASFIKPGNKNQG